MYVYIYIYVLQICSSVLTGPDVYLHQRGWTPSSEAGEEVTVGQVLRALVGEDRHREVTDGCVWVRLCKFPSRSAAEWLVSLASSIRPWQLRLIWEPLLYTQPLVTPPPPPRSKTTRHKELHLSSQPHKESGRSLRSLHTDTLCTAPGRDTVSDTELDSGKPSGMPAGLWRLPRLPASQHWRNTHLWMRSRNNTGGHSVGSGV